jgi:hypothetical protein
VWVAVYPFSYDESFTAMAGRHGLSSLPAYLRAADVHPPLDYVLRAPLAHLGVGDFVFRTPSVVLSVAALALFAFWMRDRGRVGLIATLLLAVSPFQIGYGSEARMYAALQLVGIAAALVTEQWLSSPRRWHAPVVAGLVLLGLLDHVSAFLLVAGVLAVAGTRRDLVAWRWRAWVAAGVASWGALWGASFLDQLGVGAVGRIPRTSAGRFVDAVSNSVTFTNGLAVLVAAAVAVGGALLCRSDRRLGQVWLALGVLPYIAGAALGLFVHFFLDRSLTIAAWAPALAIAWLLDVVMERSVVERAVAVAAVVVLAVPSTIGFLAGSWGSGASADVVAASAAAGDRVVVVPAWYHQLVDWEIGVHGPAGSHRVAVDDIADAAGVVVGDHRRGRRTWLVTMTDNPDRYTQFPRCAPDRTDGSARILCLETSD